MHSTKKTTTARKSREPTDIEVLRNRIEEVVGETVLFGGASDLPPDLERKFLESVLAFESTNQEPLIQHLRRSGSDPQPPDALRAEDVHASLWTLIEALARLGVYLYHTDHLSDVDLYRYLWDEELPQPIAIVDGDRGEWHLDLVSNGSDESIRLWLTYYADEDDREEWKQDFPGDVLPAAQPPPFRRNHLLPRPDGPRLF